MSYFIYILKCSDGTFYTGSTNNLEKRLEAHNTKKTAAKYTKARRPVKLIYHEVLQTKNEALVREIQIKRLSRPQKQILIEQ